MSLALLSAEEAFLIVISERKQENCFHKQCRLAAKNSTAVRDGRILA
jgi:hypothetical protein